MALHAVAVNVRFRPARSGLAWFLPGGAPASRSEPLVDPEPDQVGIAPAADARQHERVVGQGDEEILGLGRPADCIPPALRRRSRAAGCRRRRRHSKDSRGSGRDRLPPSASPRMGRRPRVPTGHCAKHPPPARAAPLRATLRTATRPRRRSGSFPSIARAHRVASLFPLRARERRAWLPPSLVRNAEAGRRTRGGKEAGPE
jgi:hypothetical protein